jgi:GT2 family glycosyltransferase
VPTAKRPSLAVIMVSYRTGEVLFDSLDTVLAEPLVNEIILVNHENPPEHVDRLVTLSEDNPRLKLVHTFENQGFARGCNRGVRESSSDYLLFLNPDTLVPRGAVERLLDTAATTKEPSIIGARLIGEDGAEQRGARRGELTFGSAIVGFLGIAKLVPGWRDIHREHEPLPDAAMPVPAVSGAAMLMSRRGFDQVDGFDERYFLHVEDLDICKRVRALGGDVIFEPRAPVIHYGSTSRVSLFKVEMWKARGLVRYFHSHGGPLGWLKAMLLAVPIYGALIGRTMFLRLRG